MTELRLGDCLDVMRGMPDASVDAVVTDPPAPPVPGSGRARNFLPVPGPAVRPDPPRKTGHGRRGRVTTRVPRPHPTDARTMTTTTPPPPPPRRLEFRFVWSLVAALCLAVVLGRLSQAVALALGWGDGAR